LTSGLSFSTPDDGRIVGIQNIDFIESVSRLVHIAAGDDFLGLCDQKCSYKHVSDFGRLQLWAFFNSRTRPHVNRVLRNQLAGDVLSLVAYRLRKLQRATRAVYNRTAACVAVGGGIFKNQLQAQINSN